MLNQKIAILIYHQVLDDADPLRPFEVDRQSFRQQVEMLTRWFNVLPLREALERQKSGTLPRHTVCITFDDGYANNLTNAMPILKSLGVSGSFFIATGFSDGQVMFNDLLIEAVKKCRSESIDFPELDTVVTVGEDLAARRAAVATILEKVKYLPLDERLECARRVAKSHSVDASSSRMMTPEEIRELRSAGMEIGAHTVSHPILQKLEDSDARREIAESKRVLEEIIEEEVRTFAYPNGKPGRDYSERDVEIVGDCGFEYALSTQWSLASRESVRFELPRVSIGTLSGVKLFAKGMLQKY